MCGPGLFRLLRWCFNRINCLFEANGVFARQINCYGTWFVHISWDSLELNYHLQMILLQQSRSRFHGVHPQNHNLCHCRKYYCATHSQSASWLRSPSRACDWLGDVQALACKKIQMVGLMLWGKMITRDTANFVGECFQCFKKWGRKIHAAVPQRRREVFYIWVSWISFNIETSHKEL